MFTHEYLLTTLAKEHTRDLIDQASRHRLAASLRRGRRQLWPEPERVARAKKAVPASTRLVSCEVPATRAAAGQAR